MKIKFSHLTTVIRVGKDEFNILQDRGYLYEDTSFPGGKILKFELSLNQNAAICLNDNKLEISLPSLDIHNHRPSKIGLSYQIPMENENIHHVIFEVDIKKSPLGSKS